MREKEHELERVERWGGSVRRENSVIKIHSVKKMFIKAEKKIYTRKMNKTF